MPTRHQRQRTRGWRTPLDAQGRPAVYVGRGTRWGNPFEIVRQADGMLGIPLAAKNGSWPTFTYEADARAEAVRLYRDWAERTVGYAVEARVVLAGRDLMCWCPTDQPCHADALLDLITTAKEASA